MNLWATEAHLEEVERGEFSCPQCKKVRPYRYFQVPTYFTFLAAPLFKNGLVADYIECFYCKRQFAPSGVSLSPAEPNVPRARAA